MPGKSIYISTDQLEALEVEAAQSRIKLDDLIKAKLGFSSNNDTANQETTNKLLQAIAHLAGRVQNVELILSRYCVLSDAELQDLGYIRGAIEVQAARKPEVAKAAMEKEKERSQLSSKVRAEIDQYLQ